MFVQCNTTQEWITNIYYMQYITNIYYDMHTFHMHYAEKKPDTKTYT